MKKASLVLRIWRAEGLPKSVTDDLSEAFEPHAEHVRDMLAQGYTSGEIVDDKFSGWWEISHDEEG